MTTKVETVEVTIDFASIEHRVTHGQHLTAEESIWLWQRATGRMIDAKRACSKCNAHGTISTKYEPHLRKPGQAVTAVPCDLCNGAGYIPLIYVWEIKGLNPHETAVWKQSEPKVPEYDEPKDPYSIPVDRYESEQKITSHCLFCGTAFIGPDSKHYSSCYDSDDYWDIPHIDNHGVSNTSNAKAMLDAYHLNRQANVGLQEAARTYAGKWPRDPNCPPPPLPNHYQKTIDFLRKLRERRQCSMP